MLVIASVQCEEVGVSRGTLDRDSKSERKRMVRPVGREGGICIVVPVVPAL